MFRRPLVVRRGPGLLGAAAVGGVAYAAGRGAADRAARERRQDEQIANLEAGQAPAPPPAPASDERIRQLRELGELKASGVLSEDEFQREKARILGPG
jgi:hypothetical protein